LWESNIDEKFIKIITDYPETKEVLPILLAVREKFRLVLNVDSKKVEDISHLFMTSTVLNNENKEKLLHFFQQSWLKDIFQSKTISDLSDYVFGIETGLDSNARKNRSWTLMEKLVEEEIKKFCSKKWYQYKEQATAKRILENRGISIESDKSNRRFDFWIFNWDSVFLIETNFYGWGGSKLKAVAWEFSYLYNFLAQQGIKLLWITDWAWRQTTLSSLEEAYCATEWNIYNLQSLENWILEEIIQ